MSQPAHRLVQQGSAHDTRSRPNGNRCLANASGWARPWQPASPLSSFAAAGRPRCPRRRHRGRSRYPCASPPVHRAVNQAFALPPVEALAVNQGPVLSPRSPLRRARSAPRRATRAARSGLRDRGGESGRRGAGGGKARENWPFYDEAPAVARRGFCKPPSPPELVGDYVWLGDRPAPPTSSLDRAPSSLLPRTPATQREIAEDRRRLGKQRDREAPCSMLEVSRQGTTISPPLGVQWLEYLTFLGDRHGRHRTALLRRKRGARQNNFTSSTFEGNLSPWLPGSSSVR